jgi:hypothetical protein
MESQYRIQNQKEFKNRYLELISDFYKYRLLVYELVHRIIPIEQEQPGDEGTYINNIHFV